MTDEQIAIEACLAIEAIARAARKRMETKIYPCGDGSPIGALCDIELQAMIAATLDDEDDDTLILED